MSTLSGCNSCKQEENPSMETETETEETIEELIGEGIRVRGAFGEAVSVELEYLESGEEHERVVAILQTTPGLAGYGIGSVHLLDADEEEVQPEGVITVELDVAEALRANVEAGESNHLYYRMEDGSYQEVQATWEDGKVRFETAYIELFVITKLQPVVETPQEETPQVSEKSPTQPSNPTPKPEPAPEPTPDPAPTPEPEPPVEPCPVTMYTVFETEDTVYYYCFQHETSYKEQNDEISDKAFARAREKWGEVHLTGSSCRQHLKWDNKIICKWVVKPKNQWKTSKLKQEHNHRAGDILSGLRGML